MPTPHAAARSPVQHPTPAITEMVCLRGCSRLLAFAAYNNLAWLFP